MAERVVVRYRLPSGQLTDVIGMLEADDPLLVRRADGTAVHIERDAVVALKAVPPMTIRTRDIRALEYAAADGWPGVQREWIDGWLLRAGHGFTSRANCAVPLAESATIDVFDAVRSWFDARGLPVKVLVPDRIGIVPPGWRTVDEVIVLAADIDTLTLPPGRAMVIVDPEPAPAWLGLFRHRGSSAPRGAAEVLASVQDGVVGFGRLGVVGPSGMPLAIARAAVTTAPDNRRWVGLTAVEVAPEHRRRGLGTLICASMIGWGRDHGATHAYLQVSAGNEAALAMYAELGLVEHHRYRYAMP